MNLVDKTVRHKQFGTGKICDLQDTTVSVKFGDEVKNFIYPDAFRGYLVLNEAKSRSYVENMLYEIDKESQEKIDAELADLERQKLLKNLPRNPKAQIAIGCICNDKEEVEKDWQVFVGAYRSGHNRGMPRIPARVYPNSAVLLTRCDENQPEESRYIWGVYMANDDFVGSECGDGIIPSHEKYRILLNENERTEFPFWEYFAKETKSRKWGSVEYKYFSNTTMASILRDILLAKKGTKEEKHCEKFLSYFCELNKLNKKKFLTKL